MLGTTFREMQIKTLFNEIPPHTGQNDYHQKNLQITSVEGSVEKRGTLYKVGGNVNSCSHYGEYYEVSLKLSLFYFVYRYCSVPK